MGFLDALVGGGKKSKVDECLDRLKADPADFAAGMALADALVAQGKRRDAVKALGKLGNALQGKGRTLEAIAAFKKVEQIDPRSQITGTFLIQVDLKRLVEEHRAKAGGDSADAAPPERGAPSSQAHPLPRPSSPGIPKPAPPPLEPAEARRRRDALQATLAGIPLLKDVPPFLLELTLQKVKERTVDKGKTVFIQGAQESSLLFVASGALSVWALDDTGKDVELGTLHAGDVAGEISFLSGVPRTATLIAKETTALLELERTAIEPIVRRHRALAEALRTLYRERVLDGILAKSRLFRSLPRAERDRLARKLVPMTVEAGAAVVTEGSEGSSLFLLHRGAVRVTARRGDAEVELAVLRPHEFFGDLSAVLGTPRTATVVAAEPSDLLRLEKADLVELLARAPQVQAELQEIQLERFAAGARILTGS